MKQYGKEVFLIRMWCRAMVTGAYFVKRRLLFEMKESKEKILQEMHKLEKMFFRAEKGNIAKSLIMCYLFTFYPNFKEVINSIHNTLHICCIVTSDTFPEP